MKIIGIIPGYYGNRYIAEVSDDELGLISKGGGKVEQNVTAGTEIKVGMHWRRVQEINSAQGRLESAASSIRAVADLLSTISVVVEPPEPAKGGEK